ncbi:MAG TPA: hypothetical protein DCQ06_14555 [Myxococcales bacterium]|nr:hypothetical protein [Myxococcales bacterium]
MKRHVIRVGLIALAALWCTSPAMAQTTGEAIGDWRKGRAAWDGFYVQLGIGYGTISGTDGPQIPDARSATVIIPLDQLSSSRYAKAITTNRGSGLAAGLTFGYNIRGYASLALDLAWQGSFGAKTDMAGIGVPSFTVGIHPLRFWKSDLPMDLRLYGGVGFFELSYYYEDQMQGEPEGKSWTGTSIPLGATFTYRIPQSVFVVGLDLRYTMASYDRWFYNYSDDIKSELTNPESTGRFTTKLLLAWHF